MRFQQLARNLRGARFDPGPQAYLVIFVAAMLQAAGAAMGRESLNQFLSSLIAERVGELPATADIRVRAERANPAAALSILARVPSRTPLADDELPGTR